MFDSKKFQSTTSTNLQSQLNFNRQRFHLEPFFLSFRSLLGHCETSYAIFSVFYIDFAASKFREAELIKLTDIAIIARYVYVKFRRDHVS